MYSHMPNSKRADNDRSFVVSIGGFSRGQWGLVMSALEEWVVDHKDDAERCEHLRVVEYIVRGLECHIVEGTNGWSLGNPPQKSASPTECEALESIRLRHAKKLKEMEEFAKSIKLAQRREKRKQKKLEQQLT
jgi:hypothetical protein